MFFEKHNIQRIRRKGFTLVELLIVIIIIGILAGALLLVAGAGTDKASASKIVSNLRNLQSAAVMYYSDYNDWASNDITLLDEFMDGDPGDGYEMSGDSHVYYDGGLISTADGGVNLKLEMMANNGDVPLFDSTGESYDKGDKAVYMKVR